MRITDRLNGDTNVLCIACETYRRLSHVVADLDGPSFVAYFCDYKTEESCIPASQADADMLYRDNGYYHTPDGWRKVPIV